ncbi:MAG: HAMP domain-containing protein [Actinobacteria bacterium]|nr:HAMP domain-containing protein [Actinomycetota bacterium]
MSRPRERTGLQTWLIGSFITLGVAASLLMFLVLLPTLVGSVVSGATERTSQSTVRVLDSLSEVPGSGYGLTGQQGDAYVRRLASEVRGGARYYDIATGWHAAGLASVPGAFPDDALTQEGDLADTSFSPAPVRTRVAEGPGDARTVFSAVRVTQGGNVVGIAEVAVPVPSPAAEIGALQRRVLFAVIAVLLLATVAGVVLARVLGRRIGRVAATAATLSAGDLSARAPESSPREVATLAGGLNRMADRVEDLISTATGERDRARSLVAGLAEGVLMVDPGDAVVVTNDAAVRMLGLASGRESRVDDLGPRLVELVGRARAEAEPVEAPEVTTAEGDALAVEAVPLSEPAGTVILTIRDVTQERALERTRRELVANVSHELKTPVAAIRGLLELMEDESMPADDRREFVRLMSAESARLQRLVEEQLQLARLDSGGVPLEREPMDLAATILAAARPRAVLAEREGVTLRVEASSPVPMDGDPARLEQVLLILLDNAARHTPPGGTITVQAHVQGADAVMSVSDTGEGIAPEAIDSVFDRFYRADAARERVDQQGAGLGLAIARGIVRAHGGDITVRSGPGRGSAFTVRLPRDARGPAPG